MAFLKNIFSILTVSGMTLCAFASDVQAPSTNIRNVDKSDFFAKNLKSAKNTEAWTYQFVFDNGTRAYVNYATIVIPASGKKIGCDISFFNLKGKKSNIGRQYPLERIKEYKDQNKISIKAAEIKTAASKLEIITELNSLLDERNKKCKILK